MQESSLEAFTLETGAVLGYDYDLSAEQKAELTPFARNVYEIRKERDNVVISRHSNACDFKRYGDAAIVFQCGIGTAKFKAYRFAGTTSKNGNFVGCQVPTERTVARRRRGFILPALFRKK